jgi:hypothetical protein
MLMAERCISKKVSKTYHWSPALSAAIYTLSYWKLQLTQHHGKIISSYTLNKIFKKTQLEPALTQSLPLEVVVRHIRLARATLKTVQTHHIELRDQHLHDLMEAIVLSRNPSLSDPGKAKILSKRKAKEINHIKRKEALARMHRTIGFTLRPGLEQSRLSQVDVPVSDAAEPFPKGPDPKTWTGPWSTVNQPIDIAKHVCAANRHQYNQAQSTPFRTEPLATHIGYKADTIGAADITAGKPLPDHIGQQLIPETRAIFDSLQSLASISFPQQSPIITTDQLASCYNAMDERTSSSPSGRHLGHYKAAINSPSLSELHSFMISIPLVAGFSPRRW